MSYAETVERLKKIRNAPGGVPTKPTKPGCVSSVSTAGGASENFTITDEGQQDLARTLADACRKHQLDPKDIRQRLTDAGDWEGLTPPALQAYVAAVARSGHTGTRGELLALIDRWADAAHLDAHRRQELQDAAQALAPAFVGENCEYFRRRLDKVHTAPPDGASTAPLVRCRDCRHWAPDTTNPSAGLGACTVRTRLMQDEAPPYPNAARRCTQFSQKEGDQ